ncbi:MAG: YceI family protein [Chloroflexi bacterium]|nr:YceI family protein [Chloroflexota bacterium]
MVPRFVRLTPTLLLALSITATLAAATLQAGQGRAESQQVNSTASGSRADLIASSPAAQPGLTRLTLTPGASEARFRVRESLVGIGFPVEAVGTTKEVSGTIVIDESGGVVSDQSRVEVGLTTLTSDERLRDTFIRIATLQVNRFPNASFTPTEIRGLSLPLPVEGTVPFEIIGGLTVRDQTRQVTWTGSAQVTASNVSGNATTRISFSQFDMETPRAGPVLGVENEFALELSFAASREFIPVETAPQVETPLSEPEES